MGKTDSANLDFLRAYAVPTVYIGHVLQTFHIERIFGGLSIYDFAQTGVLIFFVHTSLVLMLSLERTNAAGGELFRSFYIRRAFRIYPLSIATVLVMVMAHVPDFPNHLYSRPGTVSLWSNLALVQNLTRVASYPAVLWSLPYEVQMYLVLPVLYVLLRRYSSRWLPLALWGASGVDDQAGSERAARTAAVHSVFPGWGDCVPDVDGLPRLNLPFFLWPVVITACVLARAFAEATHIPQAVLLSLWVVCFGLGYAAPHFREPGSGVVRRSAGLVAKSYGVYLSHCAALWVSFNLLRGSPYWVQGMACLALSLLFPFAMYHGIERPMIHMGMRVASREPERKRSLGENRAACASA